MEDPFFFDPTDDDDDHNAHADIEDNDEVTNIGTLPFFFLFDVKAM